MSLYNNSEFDALKARLAVEYLTSQLLANHKADDSLHSAYKDSRTIKGLDDEHRASFAWATYRTRSRGKDHSNVLRFTFNTPSLRFLCDHDALFEIKVATLFQGEPDNETSIAAQGWSVEYRVTTEVRSIIGNDSKVGDRKSRIRVLIFDFERAIPLTMPSDQWFKTYHVERHLSTYLRTLQFSGRHVLFVPPEFNVATSYLPIYFSLSGPANEYGKALDHPLTDIKGYTAEMIDDYLSLLWYTCSFISRQHGKTQAIWRSSLAEFKTWKHTGYSSDWHASLSFGAATVKILCSREVVLYFPLHSVTFYQKDEPLQEGFLERKDADYEDWAIAVVVKVIANDSGVRMGVAGGRCSYRYSQFTTPPKTEHEQALKALFAFFSEQYISIVGKTRLQYLFYRLREEHLRIGWDNLDQEPDGSWWMLERSVQSGRATILDSTIRETKMYGFDAVFAISQNSINMHLRNGIQAIEDFFPTWEHEHLVMDVKSVTVRLRNKETATILINIVDGHLNALLNLKLDHIEFEKQATPIQFGSCCLAFEVSLVKKDLPADPLTKGFTMSEINLDIANAEPFAAGTRTDFKPDVDVGHEAGTVRNTLIECVMKFYLKALEERGVHVVARVPIYDESTAASFYKMTKMAFFTYAPGSNDFGEVQDQDVGGRSEAMLFVIGMTGQHPPPSIEHFVPSHRWIVNANSSFSQGTFAIRGETLDGGLKALLANINKLTTLACTNARSKSSKVEDMVQQWKDHPDYYNRACPWSPMGYNTDRHEWRYTQSWQFSEGGTQAIARGDYSINCTAENQLQLPNITLLTTGSLEFRMSGTIKLRIASSSNGHDWSTESAATWSVVVSVKTTDLGAVKVEITDSVTHEDPSPMGADIRRTAITMPDAYKILQAHLPTKAQFRDALKELQDLEGPWEYYRPGSFDSFTLGSPTSNANGDLLFELRQYESSIQQQVQLHSITAVGPSTTTGPTDIRGGQSADGQHGQSSSVPHPAGTDNSQRVRPENEPALAGPPANPAVANLPPLGLM